MKKFFLNLKSRLSALSFRTGLWVLCACAICYVLSFAQALLPISISMKGGLWVVFFGLAKLLQYTGLLILGKEGWKRIKDYLKHKESITTE